MTNIAFNTNWALGRVFIQTGTIVQIAQVDIWQFRLRFVKIISLSMTCNDLRKFLQVIFYVVAFLVTIAHAIITFIHGINIKNSRALNVDESWKLVLVTVCRALFSFFDFLDGVAEKHFDLLGVLAEHILA